MTYAEWRKNHPSWPCRLRDMVGRQVRLKTGITTFGGSTFKRGALMTVTGMGRHTLHLRGPGRDRIGMSCDPLELRCVGWGEVKP